MLKQDVQRPRGRPPIEVDRERAVSIATDLFWRCSFDGVSIEQICAATQVSRPNLYRCFGSKELLYCAVLEAYLSDRRRRIGDALGCDETPKAGLQRLLREEITFCAKGRRGCFALMTAVPIADRYDMVRSMLSIDVAWRHTVLLRSVQDIPELEDRDASECARAISAILDVIGIHGRLGFPDGALERTAGAAMSIVLQPLPSATESSVSWALVGTSIVGD